MLKQQFPEQLHIIPPIVNVYTIAAFVNMYPAYISPQFYKKAETGLSCSFAVNRTAVDACNAFSILPSSLRLQLTHARTFDKALLCGSRPFFNIFIIHNKSGRRDSNPRRQPWEGCILPLNYFRI